MDCPLGSMTCKQAGIWFEMLRDETTESDVTFFLDEDEEVVHFRVQQWHDKPPNIFMKGYDTNPALNGHNSEYRVDCPSDMDAASSDCECGISIVGALNIDAPLDAGGDYYDDDANTDTSSRANRRLSSILHSHHDVHIASQVEHLELAPLASVPCHRVAELHGKANNGGKPHVTFTCPVTGMLMPVALTLKASHVVADLELGSELVLSLDAKLSPLSKNLGHVKVVCPHGNATDAWLRRSAVDDPMCACNVYGVDGLALSINYNYFPSTTLAADLSASAAYGPMQVSTLPEEVTGEGTLPPPPRSPPSSPPLSPPSNSLTSPPQLLQMKDPMEEDPRGEISSPPPTLRSPNSAPLSTHQRGRMIFHGGGANQNRPPNWGVWNPSPPPPSPSPSPPPPPPPPQRSQDCFPAASTVLVSQHNQRAPENHQALPSLIATRMDALRLDDNMLVVDRYGKPKLSPVLFFGHQVHERSTQYVKITTAAGQEVRASPEHVILLSESSPTWSAARHVPACVAAPGMFVFSVTPAIDDLGQCRGDKIVSVELEMAQGLYAPHSYDPDALIVVDGVVCSELTTSFTNGQLWFLKGLLASLQRILGLKVFGRVHDFLHASQFPEVFYNLVVAVRSLLGGMGGKLM
ncbi:hint module-domain-containing protein [Dunaliella salina]|uniref:Hint module-domain-containing protein n=1 Tax=Dunaliella salina TaxID=3046 RepID=A0ABQ7H4X3_DUNSA|nr:hint module-domain-containing protein [Dunaliella salina]|eukprot:KAF5841843.1 hint module-domain-containing protein [Dunaliella salina]